MWLGEPDVPESYPIQIFLSPVEILLPATTPITVLKLPVVISSPPS